MTGIAKWRGLGALVGDAVEHGSRAVQRIHMETARRSFAILERLPIAEPVRAIHVVHDAIVTTTYATIRIVNAVAIATVDTALKVAESDSQKE